MLNMRQASREKPVPFENFELRLGFGISHRADAIGINRYTHLQCLVITVAIFRARARHDKGACRDAGQGITAVIIRRLEINIREIQIKKAAAAATHLRGATIPALRTRGNREHVLRNRILIGLYCVFAEHVDAHNDRDTDDDGCQNEQQ